MHKDIQRLLQCINLEEKEGKELDFKIPQTFTQYTSNSISNPSSVTIEIYGSDGSMIATVPPGGSRSFQLGGQNSLTFKGGGVSKTVGYRVTISDDYPGQLDVKFSGPVSVKQSGPLVYDVTLNFLNSKSAYDNFTENREAPFSVSFQISVKDRIATQHNVSQSGVFQFGEW